MNKEAEKCFNIGCDNLREQNDVMCNECWLLVPVEGREKIWKLYYHYPRFRKQKYTKYINKGH